MARPRTIEAYFSEYSEYFETPGGDKHCYSSSSGPYEYLLGALAGCFFYTLSSFERKCSWSRIDIKASGIKRLEIPTTLEETVLTITVHGTDDKSDFEKLVRRAEAECSIYNTIKCVSTIRTDIIYEDER